MIDTDNKQVSVDLNSCKEYLKFVLSSSKYIKFFFNESLLVDLVDRFMFVKHKRFTSMQSLLFKFEVNLPFLNSLQKFKNKIYLLLYFLVFEILTGQSPTIVPVYRKNVLLSTSSGALLPKRKRNNRNYLISVKKVKYFLFSAKLNVSNLCNLFLFLHLFASKNTYVNNVILSKQVKVCLNTVRSNAIAYFFFKAGLGNFKFLMGFDEVLDSQIKIIIMFWIKNMTLSSSCARYILNSLNFNITSDLCVTNKKKNKIFNIPNSFYGSKIII